MVSKKAIIINAEGLHARPASAFIRHAIQFQSEILVIKNNNEYNAKSIVNILAAVIKKGEEIEVRATGPDEEEALDSIVTFIEAGLGE